MKKNLISVTTALTLVAAASAATAVPAIAAPPAIPQPAHTVVVEGDTRLGSSGEIEGSLATGGELSFETYNLNANTDQSALPKISGRPNQLLVGGRVDLDRGNKLDLNAGYGGIAETSGTHVTADGRLTTSGSAYVLAQTSPRATAVADYESTAFPSMYPTRFFDDAAASSAAIRDLEANVTARRDADRLVLELAPRTLNVWRLRSSDLAQVTSVSFSDAVPSRTTPLVIDLVDSGSSGNAIGGLRLLGDPQGNRFFAPFVTWNLQGWKNARLTGSTEMSGLVLAPRTSMEFARNNPLRGQIIARNLTITGSGEIHHWTRPVDDPQVITTPSTPPTAPTTPTTEPTTEATTEPTTEVTTPTTPTTEPTTDPSTEPTTEVTTEPTTEVTTPTTPTTEPTTDPTAEPSTGATTRETTDPTTEKTTASLPGASEPTVHASTHVVDGEDRLPVTGPRSVISLAGVAGLLLLFGTAMLFHARRTMR